VIDEKNEPCIVDKDNSRYNEVEGTIHFTGNVDNDKKVFMM
jgi:lipopolysaccharide export system protein LptA